RIERRGLAKRGPEGEDSRPPQQDQERRAQRCRRTGEKTAASTGKGAHRFSSLSPSSSAYSTACSMVMARPAAKALSKPSLSNSAVSVSTSGFKRSLSRFRGELRKAMY